MPGVLRDYTATFVSREGEDLRPGGSLSKPIKAVTVNAEFVDIDKIFHIEPGGEFVVYDYFEKNSFWKMQFIPDRYVYAWIIVDTPTSDTDLEASGLYRRARQLDADCHGVFNLSTPLCRIHPTLVTDAGIGAGDKPLAMTDVGTLPGRIYKVWIKNPDLVNMAKIVRTVIN